MISYKYFFWLCFSSSLLLSAPAWAQPETENDIEEMVVTSARTAISIKESLPTTHVITQEQIALSGPRDLASLLGRVSGVDSTDSGGRGSLSSVFARGKASTTDGWLFHSIPSLRPC